MSARRRRGAPLLVLLLLVFGLLVAADLTAKSVAEEKLADRVAAAVPQAGGRSVKIRSFPFLGRLLTSGRVGQIDARVDDVNVRGLQFDFIAVELHGVALDQDELTRNRRVILERIERGQARAELPEAALRAVLRVPIQLRDGEASVEILGRRLAATLSIRDGQLIVGGAGINLPAIELNGPLLPCVGNAEIRPGHVVLTCDFTEIPPELAPPVQL